MPADPLWINASGGSPAYSAGELRQAMAGIWMYAGRAMGARQGIRPGPGNVVTLAGSTITVQPFVGLVDPGLTTPQGPYWVALPVAENPVNGPLAAADATNPRVDIVIVRVYDHDEDASGLRTARSEYIAGTAAPSPVAPATPAGAYVLATINVPQSGGGSAVVTQTWPHTVASGGILPVRTSAEQTAVAGTYDGLPTWRRDVKGLYIHDGSSHVLVARRLSSTVTASDGTTVGGFTNTAFAVGSPIVGVAFVAPPSGIVTVLVNARFQPLSANRIIIAPSVRTGSTVGSGTLVDGASDAPALECPAVAGSRTQAGMSKTYTGLTAGSSYNVAVEHKMVTAGSGDIYQRAVTVVPSP